MLEEWNTLLPTVILKSVTYVQDGRLGQKFQFRSKKIRKVGKRTAWRGSIVVESRILFSAVVPGPTSIHIPDKLLREADKRATALGISRNRLIVRALERELQAGSDWSPGFFDRMRSIDQDTADAVDGLMSAVKAARRSKPPQRF